MRSLIIFTPYVLVPLILALIWRRFNFKDRWLTYLITEILIFFYPFFLFWIDDLINPPLPGPGCGTIQGGYLIGNTIFMVPLSLGIQFVFNYLILKRMKENPEGSKIDKITNAT